MMKIYEKYLAMTQYTIHVDKNQIKFLIRDVSFLKPDVVACLIHGISSLKVDTITSLIQDESFLKPDMILVKQSLSIKQSSST